jgi:hypothetical protein
LRKSVKHDSLAGWSRDFPKGKEEKQRKEALFWKVKISQKKEAQRMCRDIPKIWRWLEVRAVFGRGVPVLVLASCKCAEPAERRGDAVCTD